MYMKCVYISAQVSLAVCKWAKKLKLPRMRKGFTVIPLCRWVDDPCTEKALGLRGSVDVHIKGGPQCLVFMFNFLFICQSVALPLPDLRLFF